MSDQITRSDLCINCLNADTCAYCSNHTKPIIFCAEFSCTAPGVMPAEDDGMSDFPDVPDKPAGLCGNCDNKGNCTLQKTDDPVINCEEYR